MPQQEVFTPLEEGANIDTADGFQIVTAEEIMKTGEDKEKRIAKLLMDNQAAVERVRAKVAEKIALDSVE